MATDLTAHQTKGARDIAWLYGGGSRSGGGRSSGGSEGGGGSDRKRPDWMDNPPEGFRVSTSTSPDLQMAVNQAGGGRGGGQRKYIETAPDGQFIAHVLMPISPAEAAPEEPQEPVVEADAPLALDDYEQPTLDPVDLGLELGEEEEEEELAIEPAIREPALDYALDEGKGTGSTSLRDRSPVSRSLDFGLQEEEEEEAPSLEQSIFEQESTTPRSTSLRDRESPVQRVVPSAISDAAAAANRPQAALQDNTRTQDTGYLYDQGKRISQEEAEEILGAEEIARIQAEDELELGPRPSQMQQVKSAPRLGQAPQFDVGRDISITEAVALPEDAGPGLLDRLAAMGGKIGRLARDNPDLVLQGLRTIGELGGEYKRGRREQEAADRMAEEARMGTAISALTRGRVNPTVAPRMPRTSAGEGMFDVLAGIGRGGQEFMGQKRALEEQERLEGIEDETLAAERAEKDRRFGLDKYRAETERMEVTGEDPEDEEAKALAAQKRQDIDYIANQVSKMVDIFNEGGPLDTGGVSYNQTWGEGAEIQQRFDAARDDLIGYMNEAMRLGRMSDKDVQIIKDALPNRDEGAGWNRGKLQGILENIEAKNPGWTVAGFRESRASSGSGSGWGGGSAAPARAASTLAQYSDDELSNMSDEEIDALTDDEFNALGIELRKRGLR